jgi:hypothetical protein
MVSATFAALMTSSTDAPLATCSTPRPYFDWWPPAKECKGNVRDSSAGTATRDVVLLRGSDRLLRKLRSQFELRL